MPKLKPLTNDEIVEIDSRGDDMHQQLCDLCNHIEKQAIEKIQDPLGLARSFLCLSQSAGRAAQLLLSEASIQGMRDHTESLRRELTKELGQAKDGSDHAK